MKGKINILYFTKYAALIIMLLQTIRMLDLSATIYKVFPYLMVCLFIFLFVKNFVSENGDMWNSYGISWLVLFLITYCISIILNHKYSLVNNIQMLFWLALQVFVIYYYDKRRSVEYNIRFIEGLGIILIAFTTIVGLISLLMFIFDINGIMVVGELEFRYGFRNNRLFGLHGSPNYGALFSAMAIGYSIFFLKRESNKGYKVILILSCLINYSYIILSGSRTGQIAFVWISIWSLIGYFFFWNINEYKKNNYIVLKIICSILLPLLMLGIQDEIKNVYAQCAKFVQVEEVNQVNEDDELMIQEEKDISQEISFERIDTEKSVSNGRIEMWKEAFQYLIKNKPIWGHTNLGYIEYMRDNYPDTLIVKEKKVSLHNDWVTLIAGSGIVGFSIIALFSILVFVRTVKYIVRNRKKLDKINRIWLPLIIVSTCTITTVFSDAVFLIFTAESIIFWAELGFLMYIMDLDEKRNISMDIKQKLLNDLRKNSYLNDFIFSKYKSELEKRIQNTINSLSELDTVQDYRLLQKFRLQIENEHIPFYSYNVNNTNFRMYGIGNALFGDRYGKKAIFYPAIEHGLIFYPRAWSDTIETVRTGIITFGTFRKDILRKSFDIPIYCVGPYIQYAEDYYTNQQRKLIKDKLGKNLLVFISHGTDKNNITFEENQYIERIKKIGKDFDSISICVFWWDLGSRIVNKLEAEGFHIVCAGFREDPNFLPRLKEIIKFSDLVVGDSIGTNVGYCINLNKPFLYVDIEKEIVASEDSTTAEEKIRRKHMSEIEKAFSTYDFFNDKQMGIYNYYWGGNFKYTKEELNYIQSVSEDIMLHTSGKKKNFGVYARDYLKSKKTERFSYVLSNALM